MRSYSTGRTHTAYSITCSLITAYSSQQAISSMSWPVWISSRSQTPRTARTVIIRPRIKLIYNRPLTPLRSGAQIHLRSRSTVTHIRIKHSSLSVDQVYTPETSNNTLGIWLASVSSHLYERGLAVRRADQVLSPDTRRELEDRATASAQCSA